MLIRLTLTCTASIIFPLTLWPLVKAKLKVTKTMQTCCPYRSLWSYQVWRNLVPQPSDVKIFTKFQTTGWHKKRSMSKTWITSVIFLVLAPNFSHINLSLCMTFVRSLKSVGLKMCVSLTLKDMFQMCSSALQTHLNPTCKKQEACEKRE